MKRTILLITMIILGVACEKEPLIIIQEPSALVTTHSTEIVDEDIEYLVAGHNENGQLNFAIDVNGDGDYLDKVERITTRTTTYINGIEQPGVVVEVGEWTVSEDFTAESSCGYELLNWGTIYEERFANIDIYLGHEHTFAGLVWGADTHDIYRGMVELSRNVIDGDGSGVMRLHIYFNQNKTEVVAVGAQFELFEDFGYVIQPETFSIGVDNYASQCDMMVDAENRITDWYNNNN